MPILADYFMSIAVPSKEENIGLAHPPIVIINRYPEIDHKKHRFPENSQYCCIPGNAMIKYLSEEKRKPYIFSFCFTLDDRSRSYGTSLFYYEKLKIDNEFKLDKKGRFLYVPCALCILSHQPVFSAFSVFLRELYRNTIINEEIEWEGETPLSHSKSFDSLLRRGSTSRALNDGDVVQMPVERYIRYFIDYCPSLDSGSLFSLVAFQKIIRIAIPPTNALPFVDRLCFRCLFQCLSVRNVLRIVAAILQEERILLVSSQADPLTLVSYALKSLLYPFRWYHPFIPIIPDTITETISADFPYIFGVLSTQYKSEDCQNNLDGVIVVELDYDVVKMPKSVKVVEFRSSFIKKVSNLVDVALPPPDTRILYCANPSISESKFIVFEVVFGPGKLGVRVLSKRVHLCVDDNEKLMCSYITYDDDDDTSPNKRIELFKRKPVILSINGDSVVGKDFREVVPIIEKAKRPLILRLQIGKSPSLTLRRSALCSPLQRGQSVPESKKGESITLEKKSDSVDKEEAKERARSDSLRISFNPDSDPSNPPLRVLPSPLLGSPCGGEAVYRYYDFVSTEQLKEENRKNWIPGEDIRNFCEHFRIMIMLELIRLIGHYKEAFNDTIADGAEMKDILNKKLFMKGIEDDDKPFVKKLYRTQLFRHFIEDAYEYDDNYEINLFNDCITIKEEMKNYAEEYLLDVLLPSNWILNPVNVPLPTSEGLPEDWMKRAIQRETDSFPVLDSALYGERITRMKVETPPAAGSLIPTNLKETIRLYKNKHKYCVY